MWTWNLENDSQVFSPADLANNPPWLPKGAPRPIESLSFSPDGALVASADWDNVVRIYDCKTAKLQHRLVGHTQKAICVVFLPDGKRVLSSAADTTIRLWDIVSGKELARSSPQGQIVRWVALSADGRQFLSAGYDWTVRQWDVPN